MRRRLGGTGANHTPRITGGRNSGSGVLVVRVCVVGVAMDGSDRGLSSSSGVKCRPGCLGEETKVWCLR